MRKSMKKNAALLMTVLMLGTTVTGCGGSEKEVKGTEVETTVVDETTESEATEADETAEVGEQLSEEDYKAKVTEIMEQIEEVSLEVTENMDMTDEEAMIQSSRDMIAAVKPLYDSLGALNAPDSLKTQQEAIKVGADASIELLNISLEMFEMAEAEVTEEEAQEKLLDLMTKMEELTVAATEMQVALTEVMTAN